MAPRPTSAPLSKLLGACAAELADLRSICAHLQGVLSPTRSPGAMKDAQSLDLATQTLAALSQYLSAIAEDTPGHWTLDPTTAAAALPLAGLADRLLGIEGSAHVDGDLCLFEAPS